MDLHAGWHAKGWHPEGDCVVDVPRGSVAAGEEDEVYAQRLHLACGSAGIRCRRLTAAYRADDGRSEAREAGFVLTHLVGVGDDLRGLAGPGDHRQCLHGAASSLGLGPKLPGPAEHVRAVGALEPDAATHTGYRVDYQP